MLDTLISLLLVICLHVIANTERITFHSAKGQIKVEGSKPYLLNGSLHLKVSDLPRLRGPKSHLGGHKVTNYWQTKTNEAWAVLENLSFGEQYEVRVCFPASTPALLRLEIWEPSEAFAGDAAASLAGFEIGDEPNLYRGGLATDDKFSVALRIIIEREGVPTGRADARFGSDFVYNLDLEPIYFGVIPSSAVTLVPVILLAFVLGHFGIHILWAALNLPAPNSPLKVHGD